MKRSLLFILALICSVSVFSLETSDEGFEEAFSDDVRDTSTILDYAYQALNWAKSHSAPHDLELVGLALIGAGKMLIEQSKSLSKESPSIKKDQLMQKSKQENIISKETESEDSAEIIKAPIMV